MSDTQTTRDRRARRGLFVSIVVGLVLGFVLGAPRYGVMNPSTWNLTGLMVIATVSLYAVALLFRARARASS